MNNLLFDQARAAYQARDFASAAQFFAACKDPSEPAGEADHLRGNALMKLGLIADAAEAYESALADAAYGHRGALLTNEGKARTALGDLDRAVACFRAAVQDPTYATPYKAQLALGDILIKQGNVTEAGVAFRQAAIDETNPEPAAALSKLGGCFVELGRPQDAIEAYRTALDFASPSTNQQAIYAGLGQACVAASRMEEALDAFGHALEGGTYALTPEQNADYQRAQDIMAGQASLSATPASVSASTSGVLYDPLDPLGKSGEFMPDPSDTGFFTLTENEMIQQDKREMKIKRKRKHTGLKVFIVLLLVLLLAAGGAAFALYQGFGIPSQQDALNNLFTAVSAGEDATGDLASALSDEQKQLIVSMVPQDATAQITNMDQSMTESTASVEVTLSAGGVQDYTVTFVRDGIGWAVSGMTLDFGSTGSDEADAGQADDAGNADAGADAASDGADGSAA